MMKGSDLLRIVDQMHHEKNIDRDIIFEGIEAALQLATQKKYGEESGVVVSINRESGEILARKGEENIDPAALGRAERPGPDRRTRTDQPARRLTVGGRHAGFRAPARGRRTP